MNLTKNKPTTQPAPQKPPAQAATGTEPKKKANLNLDLKKLRTKLNKLLKLANKHTTFAAILLILLAYLFVVWKISHLATAEPDPTSDVTPTLQVPKIDKNAIKQIQDLEQSSTQVHSLFNAARNNPFQE